MHWKSGEFSEYSDTLSGVDYTDPSYYRPSSAPKISVEPEPAPSEYVPFTASPESIDTALAPEYRGPADLQNYIDDTSVNVETTTDQADSEGQDAAQKGKKRKGLAGLGGLGAVIAALLKLQWLVVFAKFGFAGVTAFISVAAYALIFGWPFAIGIVVLLFIHEMGHAVVMKLKGVPIGGMVFIPLLGAAVFMRQMPKNAKDEAEVGIAGPVAGALASLVCLALALQPAQGPTIWAPLAYFGFFINLFNLIPIVPFDGGRVLAAIDRRIWIVGFIGLIGFAVWTWIEGNFSPWLLLFIVMAGAQFWLRRDPKTPEARAYYAVPLAERIILSLAYFGLAVALILGMSLTHNMIGLMGL